MRIVKTSSFVMIETLVGYKCSVFARCENEVKPLEVFSDTPRGCILEMEQLITDVFETPFEFESPEKIFFSLN